MMAVVGLLVFAAALAGSLAVFAFTLAPAMPRIVALLRGEPDPASPASIARPMLVISDRRLRARVLPVAVTLPRQYREAA